jgi:hypothetical protein
MRKYSMRICVPGQETYRAESLADRDRRRPDIAAIRCAHTPRGDGADRGPQQRSGGNETLKNRDDLGRHHDGQGHATATALPPVKLSHQDSPFAQMQR